MNEERMEDRKEEGAAAAAATAVELPNSTASTMETSRDGECPDLGAPPARPVPIQRPLEHLMRDVGLEAKEGDIIFPVSHIGRPPPYDHELSAENRKRAEEAMKKICSLHLQAIYNAGAVRQVDRILAELLMAQFTRVNQMMGADLNTSLQEFFTVIEMSGGILLEELKTALGPTVSNMVPYNLQRVVESHNSRLYMSVTKVLVFLDCAKLEGRDFLEDLVKSLQTDEELKKLLTALSKQISAFEDHIWSLALSKELAEEEVALCVNLALMATRPVMGNCFNRVLEGLVGSLGIKIHEDEDPPRSTQEGLEKCLAKELEQLSVSSPSFEGCESRGLHVGYSLQYADPGKGPSVPALSSMALPNLLDAIDCLWLGISTLSVEDQSSEEQQDLLESLAAKGVLLDSQEHLVGHVHLTDIAKAERGSTSESGAAKRKEPDTPDLGSEGASAPVWKRVKIEGATYQHGSAPGIHIGASLHDVLERDEDDDYEKDGEEGNEDYDDCDEDTAKDEDNEEEEEDAPNLLTPIPFLPNVGLGANRLNRMNKSPPWQQRYCRMTRDSRSLGWRRRKPPKSQPLLLTASQVLKVRGMSPSPRRQISRTRTRWT